MPDDPLTLGTAGHIDHGKTSLVAALTGVDTDRLPEERARGMTIALGYAPLALPGGRRLSVVDVPGHERFVRTMVAGATGIDLFLLVVAADDGVMPQTREHLTVLRGLGVQTGVVAVTKADLADPAAAVAEVHELVPEASAVVACSSRTGAGLDELRAALARAAEGVASRAGVAGAAVLHVDRSFSVAGRGTVVTGTLWRGELALGDHVTLHPGSRGVRVRGLQVHDVPVERAAAGQRVAVALAGVRAREIGRGDVLTADAALRESSVLDCALALAGEVRAGEEIHLHHGTRDVPGRLVALGEDLWQLRLDRPVAAADGDRVVVRRASPPDTLGGGRVLDAAARRHGRREDVLERLRARRDGRPDPRPPDSTPSSVSSRVVDRPVSKAVPAVSLSPAAIALGDALRVAGAAFPSEGGLDAGALKELRDAGRAVRVSGRLYGDAEVVAGLAAQVVGLLEREGSASLAEVRDALALSRKPAQAILEHLDAARTTRRGEDDRRTLLRRA